MSHNVETMAWVGEVPWHGLGKEVPQDLSPKQMLKAAGLDRNDTNKTIYSELSEAVRIVADEFAMSARDMQALIWIVYRGSAE